MNSSQAQNDRMYYSEEQKICHLEKRKIHIFLSSPSYPTLPSISSSISLFSSPAYSSGSFLITGATNQLTIIARAFSSSKPRDIM